MPIELNIKIYFFKCKSGSCHGKLWNCLWPGILFKSTWRNLLNW